MTTKIKPLTWTQVQDSPAKWTATMPHSSTIGCNDAQAHYKQAANVHFVEACGVGFDEDGKCVYADIYTVDWQHDFYSLAEA